MFKHSVKSRNSFQLLIHVRLFITSLIKYGFPEPQKTTNNNNKTNKTKITINVVCLV